MHFIMMALLAQTTPADDPVSDWLLKQAVPATRPAEAPATQAGNPFGQAADTGPKGTITLSDGTTLAGVISGTPGKPLRFWVEDDKRYVDVTLTEIATMDADVLWERDEPEWRFAASGQDRKVYTGKTYPARETAYRVKLQNGDTFVGSTAAPLTISGAGGDTHLILHKRDKGDVGMPLAKLIYVKSLVIEKP